MEDIQNLLDYKPGNAMEYCNGNEFLEDSTNCDFCALPICDQFYCKVEDKNYHEHCLNCCVCGQPLAVKCFLKEGRIYCRRHYYRECSPIQCAGCKLGIAPTDLVYKIKVDLIYHATCHRCFECGQQLGPGEQIIVDEQNKAVSCSEHYDLTGAFSYPSEDHDLPSSSCSNLITANFADCSSATSSLCNFTATFATYTFEDFCASDDGKYLKRRGPRTNIKQEQLDILNRIFSTSPKPSKHARAKLALETGLSMRVIQVWFQNRRSKERRLKHLCNYLRHYEQRGLVAPPIAVAQNGDLLLPKNEEAEEHRRLLIVNPGLYASEEN